MIRFSLLVALTGGIAVAQSPETSKFRTKDGHESEAVFQSLDLETGTVTLLVPRTMQLSRLDAESQQLAKDLMAKVEVPQRDPRLDSTGDPKYVLTDGIPGPDPTLADWNQATDIEKVATCGDTIYGLTTKGLAAKQLESKTLNAKSLNAAALDLYLAVSLMEMKLKQERPDIDATAVKLNAIMGAIAGSRQWLRNDSRIVKDVVFTQLKFIGEPGDLKLIGWVENNSNTDIQIAGFNLNFEVEGDLVAVEKLIVTDLQARESQTFQARLLDVNFLPAVDNLTITQ